MSPPANVEARHRRDHAAADGTRLLITARDVGAAGHIARIVERLPDTAVAYALVAQGAASRYLKARGVQHRDAGDWLGIAFDETPAGQLERSLLPLARQRMRDAGVTAVLCGLSAFHSDGIDELAMLAARSAGIPVIAIQDFWGDVKAVEGIVADRYLVIDERAAELTRARCEADVAVVGSVKHGRFGELDLTALRGAMRDRLGLAEHDYLVGHFGQNLMQMAGYREVVRDMADAAQAAGAALLYRPHPRESADSLAATLALFRQRGAAVHLVQDGAIEDALIACDVAASCFSTVGLDAVQLTRAAPFAGPVAVYCDYPQEVAAYWRHHARVDTLPLVDAGAARVAADREALHATLASLADPALRLRNSAHVKGTVPDPRDAVDAAIRHIIDAIRSPALRA